MEHRSNVPKNAEIEIDYSKKKVSFQHPAKDLDDNLNYFNHNFYTVIGGIFGIAFAIMMAKNSGLLDSLSMAVIMLTTFFSCRIIFNYISLFIHKISPAARKALPKTNAIFYHFKSKNKIYLRKKYSLKHYVDNNKLILFDYDIVFFRYRYKGKNRLLKINTKCVDKRTKWGDPGEYIAIFTFQNPITGGTLEYA